MPSAAEGLTAPGPGSVFGKRGRNAGGVVEAKDVLDLSLTRQLTRQLEGAAEKGEPFNLVISPRNRKLTGPLIRALREHQDKFGGGLYSFDPKNGELVDLNDVLRQTDG